MDHIYEMFKNTFSLLSKFRFESGLYVSEFIMVTNRYTELMKMGKSVAAEKKTLYEKLCRCSDGELQGLQRAVDYAVAGSHHIAKCFHIYCDVQAESRAIPLAQIEFFMIAITAKHGLEHELPYRFDNFILQDYAFIIKQLADGNTVILNDADEEK